MGMSPAPRAGFNRPEADCGRDEVDRPPQADEPPGTRPPVSAPHFKYPLQLKLCPLKYSLYLPVAHELSFNYQENLNNLPGDRFKISTFLLP